MLNLQVEEDEHEAGPGRVLKRPRYSPMPGPVAAVGAQLGQDEPSSSHCSDPAGEQLDSCSWSSPSRSLAAGPAGTQLETVSRLQAQLVEREAELQLQRDQAETFLRELQETVGTHLQLQLVQFSHTRHVCSGDVPRVPVHPPPAARALLPEWSRDLRQVQGEGRGSVAADTLNT